MIIGLLATVALSLVSDFLLNLPREITWLTFFVGSIVTVTATLQELRLLNMVSDEIGYKLEIYNLLNNIEDSELRKLAEKAINECLQKLRDYQSDIIASDDDAVSYATNRLSQCKKSLQSTYWAPDMQTLYYIEDDFVGRNYYQANINALKRGIHIKRIFILNKRIMLDNNRFIDDKALRILQKQQNDTVDVRISWIDDQSNWRDLIGLYQDFAIFDGKEVVTIRHGIGNIRYGTVIRKKHEQVEDYQKAFQELWNRSRPLADIVAEHNRAQ